MSLHADGCPAVAVQSLELHACNYRDCVLCCECFQDVANLQASGVPESVLSDTDGELKLLLRLTSTWQQAHNDIINKLISAGMFTKVSILVYNAIQFGNKHSTSTAEAAGNFQVFGYESTY